MDVLKQKIALFLRLLTVFLRQIFTIILKKVHSTWKKWDNLERDSKKSLFIKKTRKNSSLIRWFVLTWAKLHLKLWEIFGWDRKVISSDIKSFWEKSFYFYMFICFYICYITIIFPIKKFLSENKNKLK